MHFYRQGPGQPGPPAPHLYRQELVTFIDKVLASPAPQPLTFIDRAWASRPPNPPLLSTGPRPARPQNPSLLSTGPGPARPPTPHVYWPDPSLLLARPLTSTVLARLGRAMPGRVGTVPDRAVPI